MFRAGSHIQRPEEPIALYCAAKAIGSLDLPGVYPVDWFQIVNMVPSFSWQPKPNAVPWPTTWPVDGAFETCVMELAALLVAQKAEPRVDVEGMLVAGAYKQGFDRCLVTSGLREDGVRPMIRNAATKYANEIAALSYVVADEIRALEPSRMTHSELEGHTHAWREKNAD